MCYCAFLGTSVFFLVFNFCSQILYLFYGLWIHGFNFFLMPLDWLNSDIHQYLAKKRFIPINNQTILFENITSKSFQNLVFKNYFNYPIKIKETSFFVFPSSNFYEYKLLDGEKIGCYRDPVWWSISHDSNVSGELSQKCTVSFEKLMNKWNFFPEDQIPIRKLFQDRLDFAETYYKKTGDPILLKKMNNFYSKPSAFQEIHCIQIKKKKILIIGNHQNRCHIWHI